MFRRELPCEPFPTLADVIANLRIAGIVKGYKQPLQTVEFLFGVNLYERFD
jgi:hypothetical protein